MLGIHAFQLTGTAPTGMSTATGYFAVVIDANTFHVATSVANAVAGTYVNTSSTGSGCTCYTYANMASNTNTDIAGLKLTAGDWDVYGGVAIETSAVGTVSNVYAWIGTVSVTPSNQQTASWSITGISTVSDINLSGLVYRQLGSGVQGIYLSAAQYNGTNWGGYGTIFARRSG